MFKNTKLGDMIDDLKQFSAILGSFAHDVGHRGKNNIFEINSYSELAVRYHDKSVLE